MRRLPVVLVVLIVAFLLTTLYGFGKIVVVAQEPGQITPTYTPTLTSSPTATHTPTWTSSPMATDTPTLTPTWTPSSTDTPSYTPTFTSSPTETHTPTYTPTWTSSPTETYTPTYTPTVTSSPTETQTPVETLSETVVPTNTSDVEPAFTPIELELESTTSTETVAPTSILTGSPSPAVPTVETGTPKPSVTSAVDEIDMVEQIDPTETAIASPTPEALTFLDLLCQWDIDKSKDLAVNDLMLFSSSDAYGSKLGDAVWDPDYDINADGSVDVIDLQLILAFVGADCL